MGMFSLMRRVKPIACSFSFIELMSSFLFLVGLVGGSLKPYPFLRSGR